ncbi:MAG: membrane protease YdiL (CAAX protease family) [Marinobacter maritimus]|jgi:membrane protease YdiL (CAAX protease family)|uniref:CPBP family intramembrane glutamic endopeptidase n=1 Tax=Marinobacter maritimus TaxID=277961 RepID=UPI000BDDB187|nr:CPBP family intramembrane glutamic endopeptidase [Marinobacter maritimus]MBL1272699.1 CPBP family intramembrane metalloprotease [Oceanospirillales bacterium]|tara:strand:+ start:34 stop:636 length:603 start_codon:yes stop_codon:yes gene_type:complete
MALNNRRKSTVSPVIALVFQGGIGVVGLLAILILGIPVQISGDGILPSVLYGVLGALCTYAGLLLLTQIPGLFPNNLARQMRGLHRFASGYSWFVLFLLSVFAGVGEELLFRGALQGWLTVHTNTTTAVLAASVLFGLVHYASFTYFVVAAGLGLVLGLAYAITDSILLVMVWHGVYDLVALFCLLRFPEWFGISVRSKD